MVQNFKFKQNDTYGFIDYSLLNSDGTPFVIPSDATVSLYVSDKSYQNLLINKTASIVDYTNGQVSYQLQQGDLISFGDFIGEFRVTFSNGQIKSFPQNGYLILRIDQSINNGESQFLIKVTEIQDFENSITDTVNGQIARVDNLITSTPQPSEVVDARTDASGKSYTVLGDRLNNTDEQLAEKATQTDLATTNQNVSLKANQSDLTTEITNRQSADNGLQTQINNIVVGSGTSSAEVVQARGNYNVLNDHITANDLKLSALNSAVTNGMGNYVYSGSFSTNTNITGAVTSGIGPSQAYENGFIAPDDIQITSITLNANITTTQFILYAADSNFNILSNTGNITPTIINHAFTLPTPLSVPKGGKLFMRFLNGTYYYLRLGSSSLHEYQPGVPQVVASPIQAGYDITFSVKTINMTNPTILSTLKLTDPLMPKYKETSGYYGYIGRWWPKVVNGVTYQATNNQGSQICFKVTGVLSINVNFNTITTPAYTPYFAYSIDGASFVRQKISSPSVTLPDTNEHIVRIIVDGMGENDPTAGGKWYGSIGLIFMGVDVGSGTITGLLPINKEIMFFGDSITEGINVLGSGATADTNSASSEYSFICSSQLNAIPYYVGYGGTGVLGDASFHKCIDAINYYYTGVATGQDYPDIIVMAHGYNDNTLINNGTNTSSDFIAAYNAVLDRLKVKYPGVPIVCVVPFGAQAIEPYIKTCLTNRNYCYLVESTGWTITTTDGVHPDVNGAKTLGTNIATAIQNIFGKNYFMS